MRYHVPNYLSNSVRAAKRFGGDIWQEVKKTDWANLPKDVVENVGEGVHRKTYKGGGGRQAYTSSGVGGVSGLASDFLGKTVGSDEWRQRYVWPYTNPYRLINDTVGKVSEKIPLSKAAQAAVAVGTPILYHQLTESSGPLSQGMRPKGWKAAVPASKEKDPTGKTPISLPEEAAARWVLGQKSQLLPYDEFKKERPDVMPSTLANYRGYMNKKPKPGERINVDTDKGSFTALGGAVRGTSRGLHDPEIRLKGVPISLNATLGTAAGLATIAAGKQYLDPEFMTGGGKSFFSKTKAPSDYKVKTESPLQGQQVYSRENPIRTRGTRGMGPVSPKFKKEDRVIGGETIPGDIRYGENLLGQIPRKVRVPGKSADEEWGDIWRTAPSISAKYGEKRSAAELFNAKQAADQLNPKKVLQPEIPGLGAIPGTNQAKYEAAKENVDFWQDVANKGKQTRAEWETTLPKAAQQFQKLKDVNIRGKSFDLREPALLVGGALAAVGTAATARKLFQKAEERRIKKEAPVEYLKYKHGNFEETKEALGKPEASTWKDLTQTVI